RFMLGALGLGEALCGPQEGRNAQGSDEMTPHRGAPERAAPVLRRRLPTTAKFVAAARRQVRGAKLLLKRQGSPGSEEPQQSQAIQRLARRQCSALALLSIIAGPKAPWSEARDV